MARGNAGLHKAVPFMSEFVNCILMYSCDGWVKYLAVELKVNSTNFAIFVPGKLS